MKRFSFFIFFFLAVSAVDAQVINLRGPWKFHIGDRPAWASAQLDDSSWEEIEIAHPWEDQGFYGYDGFAWYRIKFDGKKLTSDQNYFLGLGFIDDCDEAYINGKLVGLSGLMPPKFKTAFNTERKYPLPEEFINFNGENVIAVRVFDNTLSGGMVAGIPGIYSGSKDKHLFIDLQGIWTFTLASSADRPGKNVEENKLMVPGPWDQQGFYKYDGYAWYKKTFTIPANLPVEEDLVLILGKIDDFDITYLNGREIGRTNDRKRFGSSNSWQQKRVYTIPSDLLKRKEKNVIEVLVQDLGNTGGIYEGPIGITSRTNYLKYFR